MTTTRESITASEFLHMLAKAGPHIFKNIAVIDDVDFGDLHIEDLHIENVCFCGSVSGQIAVSELKILSPFCRFFATGMKEIYSAASIKDMANAGLV